MAARIVDEPAIPLSGSDRDTAPCASGAGDGRAPSSYVRGPPQLLDAGTASAGAGPAPGRASGYERTQLSASLGDAVVERAATSASKNGVPPARCVEALGRLDHVERSGGRFEPRVTSAPRRSQSGGRLAGAAARRSVSNRRRFERQSDPDRPREAPARDAVRDATSGIERDGRPPSGVAAAEARALSRTRRGDRAVEDGRAAGHDVIRMVDRDRRRAADASRRRRPPTMPDAR